MKTSAYIGYISLLGLLLGIHNGYVALWKDGAAQPVQVFPYAASALPDQDRLLLERGIPIENQHQLTQLLQDYLS